MSIKTALTRQTLAALSQRVSVCIALLIACTFFFSPVANAQFDNGSLVGTVHDTTGAVVPGAAVTVTNKDTANRTLSFSSGDTFGLNLSGASHNFQIISNSGVLATSLQRMMIIHYYINASGFLVRRVFGVQGTGFRDSIIAEHILNVQYNYSLDTTDVIVLPTLPDLPISIKTALNETSVIAMSSLIRPFNLSGHPALSLPIAIEGSPLKAGLQIVGRKGADETVCAVASRFEAALNH